MAPSREAAQDEVNVCMLCDSCSTTVEVARSRLCHAIHMFPELSTYSDVGLHSYFLLACFEELVGGLPAVVAHLPVEAQLKKVSNLLAGYSNLVISLKVQRLSFLEMHSALVLALSENVTQWPKEHKITEDGVTKMQTGSSWHDKLHEYVHEAAFCAVENAVSVLLKEF